ncbi:MAG: ABC transporter permease [Planctomycetota bacterium]|jgi:phospholipid/cholesterol/gamma-HCH transport system permease protein|nr:ABC transporter permease [Planctomycetota bacterium]
MYPVQPVRYVGGFTRTVGRTSVAAVMALGELSVLLGLVVTALLRDRQRRRTVVLQLYSIGYLSLPVVVLTGVSTGMVLAVQSYVTLARVKGETMTGAMVNFSLVAELAPVLTGLMLAGRVGSSVAAEIGTMKVTEQLDALRVMGTDPISYLVAPRFLACVLLMPLLVAICGAVGVGAADWLATAVWDIDKGAYWDKVRTYVDAYDIVAGLLKGVFFGGIISLVACRKGLHTEGGAAGVGTACTEGVVSASILILVGNFVLTLVFQQIHKLIY